MIYVDPHAEDDYMAAGGHDGFDADLALAQEAADRADERADVPRSLSYGAACSECGRPWAVFVCPDTDVLRPCPFCGSDRTTYRLHREHDLPTTDSEAA